MTTYYLSRWDCWRLGAMSVTITESVAGAVLISFAATTSNRFYHGDATDNTDDGTLPADGGTRCFGVALQNALNTTGILANTYTVSFAATTGLYTIARATGTATFDLTYSTLGAAGRRMRQAIGHSGDKTTLTTTTSDRSPYYYLAPSGGRTNDSGRQKLRGYPAGVVSVSSGGRVYGSAPYSTAYGRRWEQWYQSDAACHDFEDTTADGDVWTWERFFEHHRSGERFLFFDFGTTVTSYANRERAYSLAQSGVDEWTIERMVATLDSYWRITLDVVERDQGDPAGAGAVLLDLSQGSTTGTFTRASAATYQTSATTITDAVTDERRYEDRGDGYGPLLLLEGASTNVITRSESMESGSRWTQDGLTGAQNVAGPDGTVSGDRLTSAGTGSYTREYITTTHSGSIPMTYSIWYRDGSQNTGAHSYSFGISQASYSYTAFAPTAVWVRAHKTVASCSANSAPFNHINNNGTTGPASASGDDVVVAFAQHENLSFPSSYIPSDGGSTTTRAADTLTIASGSVPEAMKSGRWQIAVYPLFGSSDMVSGDIRVLASFSDANNSLRIRHDGTNVRIEAYDNSSVVAASGYITFSRHQRLTITIDCAAATVGVTGATTGDGTGSTGTVWTWPAGTLRIGGNVSATGEAFCRFGSPKVA